jgi:hypothetical protein
MISPADGSARWSAQFRAEETHLVMRHSASFRTSFFASEILPNEQKGSLPCQF